ncbi:MAG: hypothetical protein KatS3mg129_1598 [Leptospiraceae bacterium]|nr:MAG: hypothetical protein KatS3mg129_1598 [Leptospiraceae bacterium]
MVQVDVIWSYAFGATLASAASKQIKKESEEKGNPFINKYFVYLLLFLSLLFNPSGIYLLWQFPHWETMQVAWQHSDLPAWLVTLFSFTNITQGVLGYYITYLFIKNNKYYYAHVNWIVAWTLFWSFLVMGWDTTGWQRFLYDPTKNNMIPWKPGMHMGFKFFLSNVFLTLVAMAIPIGPAYIIPFVKWIKEQYKYDPVIKKEEIPSTITLFIACIGGTFGITLFLAILNGLWVFYLYEIFNHLILAYSIGIISFWFLAYLLLFKKNRLIYHYAKLFFIKD